jgi:hypothetical protein
MHPVFVLDTMMEKDIEPPEGLLLKIMNKIRLQKRRNLRLRFGLFMSTLLFSGGAAIPAFEHMRFAISESGFSQFFSLLFSDTGAVLAYAGNFTSALLESFPVMSMVLFLAVVFIFLNSVQSLIIIRKQYEI